ncbi:hypothetical protein WICPIJ_000332 [Wickerhamomyces pijperi]|uniref:pyridoxal kinase n=1 Tax=Wickerhamomyces pijperi TaxID=599730 RepID=A0A9P8TS27_WICPI|nr:hypothetical protein WICPIJ_000332 [Wickerhamomyces pijperi]
MTVPNFPKSMKILSIQSHVVHGYVGNRAVTFPLQLRGFDVDVLNTVQFSNHPAYGSFKGTRSTVEEIKDVYLGLCEIGCEYDAVLTGYVPNDDGLKTVNEICSEICSKDKNTKWFLDPVLGDNGRLYVSEGNVQTYKDILHNGLITLVTPNQLELEVLSGKKVTDLESLKVAVDTFNETYNIPNVVVTSVKLDNEPTHFYSIGSVRTTDGTYKTFYFKIPVIQASFSGSGDLFSGLLAVNYFKYSERYPEPVNDSTSLEAIPLFHSLNEVISIVDKVLQITYDYEVSKYKGLEIPSNLKINDLRIIQAQKYYLEDMANFKGTLL